MSKLLRVDDLIIDARASELAQAKGGEGLQMSNGGEGEQSRGVPLLSG